MYPEQPLLSWQCLLQTEKNVFWPTNNAEKNQPQDGPKLYMAET